MKENDIRPKELDKDKFKALEKDIEFLRSKHPEFKKVNCPACDSSKCHNKFTKYDFNFDQCTHCRTVFMNPRATPEILSLFYKNSALYDYWNKYIFPASNEVRRLKIIKPRVSKITKLVKKYKINTNKVLEIGAGFGLFCEEFQKCFRKSEVMAVEPNKSLAKSCTEKGIKTISEPIEKVDSYEEYFSILASFEVIEHLYSPCEFLLNCHRLLGKGGIIVLTCPNYEGFDIQTLGVSSESIDAEHVNLFNPRSIQHLLKRTGFEILECSTPGLLDAEIVRNKILENKLDLSEQPFLNSILVDKWDEIGDNFQTFLQQNNLSSNMWTVARKI